jgi:hypothetical protein
MTVASCPRWFVGLLLVALALGCGSGGGNQYSLDVGTDDGGPSLVLGSGDASGPAPFDAHIEQNHVTVTFVTLSCTGPCADVVAVPTGGQAPYTFEWDDGSTSASRQVCPTSSTSYNVKVTDTGTSGELARPAETVQVPLAARVIACPDGGASDGGMDAPVAPMVYWATWTQMTSGTPGSAAGSLSPPQGDVQVSYAGEVDSESAVTGGTTLSGWGPVTFSPPSTFESVTVGNAPPPTGMIALTGSGQITQTITFSTPVRDPVVAVLSGATLEFDFNASPMLLSSGSYVLGGISMSGTLTTSGQSMTVAGGAGVVQFSGTFSSIDFTLPAAESVCCFSVFTVGIRGLP